jgi:hypothetical protein
MEDQALRDYFLFDEADLSANRNGKYSEKQRKKMTQDDRRASQFVRVTGLLLTFLALIYPGVIICRMVLAAWQKQAYVFQLNITVAIFALIFGATGCYSLYCGFFDKSQDLSKVKVKKAEGPVHFVAMDSGKYTEIEYSLRVGKENMEVVDHTLKDIMKDGEFIAVYFYNPNDGTGNHVLSLEYIDSPK